MAVESTPLSRRTLLKGVAGLFVTGGMGGLYHSSNAVDDITKEAYEITIPNSPSVNEEEYRSRFITEGRKDRNVNIVSFASTTSIATGAVIFGGIHIYEEIKKYSEEISSPKESPKQDQ